MQRRNFIAGATGLLATTNALSSAPADETARTESGETARAKKVSTLKQSVMGWCFKPMDAITLAKHCRDIGLVAIEGISASDYPAVKKLGLEISLVGSHGFKDGPLEVDNHAMVETKLREGIDKAVEFGAPNVITFTGMKKAGVSDEAAKRNCVDCWKRIVPYAESKGVGLVLEHLNSVDDSHPMKGHPGYFGDDLDLCVELVQSVDSPNFKLLFDIYHVQIMHGDLIRNIRRYHEFVGHYHTAGNPGRGELDETQEINYPGVIKEIVKTGFDGYLAQEFIPTSEDPIASLRQAYEVCCV